MNASEARLGRFAQHTFLDLWCVQNPYIKKGHALNGLGDGDELCDLIVVFENDVILFSDKRCEFTHSSNLQVAWDRWLKRAVIKSARQLVGAHKSVYRYRDQLFEDSKCTNKLHLDLPPESDIRVHLIAVANGIEGPCKEYYGGGSGSLPFFSDNPISLHSKTSRPFALGPMEVAGQFIHVLDDASIRFILQHMDTVSDFIEYLVSRERFLSDTDLHKSVTGEEDLAAWYLKSGRPSSVRWGVAEDVSGVSIDEGASQSLYEDTNYLAGRSANSVSQLWDDLINHVAKEYGVIDSDDHAYRRGGEAALRCMAAPNRHERRYLATALCNARDNVTNGRFLRRFVPSPRQNGVGYLFLVAPFVGQSIEEYRSYRRWRRWHIEIASVVTCAMGRKNISKIVGIATEPHSEGAWSYDMAYHYQLEWSVEQLAQVEEARAELGMWDPARYEYRRFVSNEYPDIWRGQTAVDLNAPIEALLCTCGSGKPLANCCGFF